MSSGSSFLSSRMCSSPAVSSVVDQDRETMVYAESARAKDMKLSKPSSTRVYWSTNLLYAHAYMHLQFCKMPTHTWHMLVMLRYDHPFPSPKPVDSIYVSSLFPLHPFGCSNGSQLWDTTLGTCINSRIFVNSICSNPAWVNKLLIKSDLNPTKPYLNHDKSC